MLGIRFYTFPITVLSDGIASAHAPSDVPFPGEVMLAISAALAIKFVVCFLSHVISFF